MPALTAPAIRAVRRRFGDLADHVMALRDAGKVVRPFGDQFSVDEQPVDADGLVRLADELRARQEAKARRMMVAHNFLETIEKKPKTADVAVAPGESAGNPEVTGRAGSALAKPIEDAPPASGSRDGEGSADGSVAIERANRPAGPNCGDKAGTICPCGRPLPHGGRCWHKRGLPAPLAKHAAGRPLPRVCEKCGGPRSYWSASVCRDCYQANRKPVSQVARIDALEARIVALEAALADYKSLVRVAVVELIEMVKAERAR